MKRKMTGFTLIELLIVMFIICLVTLVVLIKTNPTDKMRTQASFAQLLKAQMELAREEAILQASIIAFGIENDTYQFYLYTEVDTGPIWAPLQESDSFWKVYKIPTLIFLSLEKTRPTNPLILFFPSGEISPFRIVMHSKNSKATTELIGTRNGSFNLVRQSND